jgi:hypothetical protein
VHTGLQSIDPEQVCLAAGWQALQASASTCENAVMQAQLGCDGAAQVGSADIVPCEVDIEDDSACKGMG